MQLRGVFDDGVIIKILSGEKPAGYVLSLTADEGRKLKSQRFNFDIGNCKALGDYCPVIVIARKGMAIDILKDAPEIFGDFNFVERLSEVIGQVKRMSIFQAVFFLLGHEDYVTGPEIAACLGLLFGYPSCCIRYFIKTRYFGFPCSIRTEMKHADTYIICEKCRKKHQKIKIKI